MPDTHTYSLYDSFGGTLLAGLAALVIIGGLVALVRRAFPPPATIPEALAVGMLALASALTGLLITDSVVAGPSAELLTENERTNILLMVASTLGTVIGFFTGQSTPRQ